MEKQTKRSLVLLLIAAWLVSGCGSTNEIQTPSTYVGAITQAHLADIYLATTDGTHLGFREVFKTFEPQTGLFTTPLPFRKFAVAEIIDETARPIAQYYDSKANDNGYLEGDDAAAPGSGRQADRVAH